MNTYRGYIPAGSLAIVAIDNFVRDDLEGITNQFKYCRKFNTSKRLDLGISIDPAPNLEEFIMGTTFMICSGANFIMDLTLL